MKIYPLRTLIGCLFFIMSLSASSQKAPKAKATKDSTKAKTGPLFNKEEVLNMTLITNFKPLMKDRLLPKAPFPYRWAKLIVENKKEGDDTLKMKIKVRGNFRRIPQNCDFPPLLLNFPGKKTKNTVFHNQTTLKLVTHCKNEEYIYQEFLVYKIYNLLTNNSFKARMAKVTYQDSLGKRAVETKPAFLLEDEAFLATRNGATIRNQLRLPLRMIDSLSMATVCVFEYMIGNTDWSLPFLHNIKLLERKDTIRAVPYDFDHSGIVNTKYAHPPEQLNLMSVRERLYRGIKYSPALFQQVFDNFRRNKAQLYALYEGNPQLSASYIKSTIKYLDEFYSDLNDPKSLKRTFVEGGGKDGTQGIIIRGFDN